MPSTQARLRIEPRALPETQPQPSPGTATVPVPARHFSLMRAGVRFMGSGFAWMAILVVVVGLLEYLQPNDQLKPSYLVGNMTGRLHAQEVSAVEKAKAAYAEGVATGELNARIVYDAKLAKIEVAKQNAINIYAADLQRTTQAWEAAYGMTSAALQGAMQMEGQLNSIRAQSVANSQGTKSFMANAADFLGVLGALTGDRNLSAMNGNGVRAEMAREITNSGVRDAGAMTRQIMGQFPNPAQFRIEREQAFQQAVAQLSGRDGT